MEELVQFLTSLVPKIPKISLVRLGPDADGGYLVPDDWSEVDALFSPGIAGSSAFELPYANKGIPCFLADASVDGPAEAHPNFFFVRKFVSAESSSHRMSFSEWFDSANISSDNIALQMDIEGSEWSVLNSMELSDIRRFRYIVIEFHDFHLLSKGAFFETATRVIRKLLDAHFVAHVHGNNYGSLIKFKELNVPEVLEVTLLRRSNYEYLGERYQLHPLDKPNNPNFRELPLKRVFDALPPSENT